MDLVSFSPQEQLLSSLPAAVQFAALVTFQAENECVCGAVVSAGAAVQGSGSIAYGNALGSIICNTALIAAVTIGLGVVLLFNPFSVVTLAFRIIGVILIVDGASDFWIGLQARRTEKNKDIQNAKSEILEVTAEEK